jgi:hypothetical protein
VTINLQMDEARRTSTPGFVGGTASFAAAIAAALRAVMAGLVDLVGGFLREAPGVTYHNHVPLLLGVCIAMGPLAFVCLYGGVRRRFPSERVQRFALHCLLVGAVSMVALPFIAGPAVDSYARSAGYAVCSAASGQSRVYRWTAYVRPQPGACVESVLSRE